MLEINPAGWFSNSFTITNPNNYSIELKQNLLGESGTLTIENTQFELVRDGFAGDFMLQNNGAIIASAHKTMLTETFDITHGDNQLTLTGRFLQRGFDLSFNNEIIGTIEPGSMFSGRADVYLPEQMPLEVQIFIAWLVLLMWRRRKRRTS